MSDLIDVLSVWWIKVLIDLFVLSIFLKIVSNTEKSKNT